MTDDKLVCECCGGRVNPATLVCEYCGTAYRRNNVGIYRIETFQAPIDRFVCEVTMDDREMYMLGPEKTSEIAIHRIADKMAEGLIPMIKYHTEFDPLTHTYKYRGEIRAIRPINKELTNYEYVS